jgi:hypothetical protein
MFVSSYDHDAALILTITGTEFSKFSEEACTLLCF